MSDINISSAVRSSLISLQETTGLIDRTQNRLATGQKVANAIDDPVAFFQAKTLNDRAFDFTEKKDGIDQGVSSLTTALEGIEGIENLVRQLKVIANSLKAATGTQFSDLVTQFSDIRTQIGLLADDTSYQGTNLVNNTTESLTVSFSEKTGSLVTINAFNVRESGLGIDAAAIGSGDSPAAFQFSANAAFTASGGDTISVTYQGSARTVDSATALAFSFGTTTVTLAGNTQSNIAISASDTLILTLQSAVGTGADTGGTGISATAFHGVIAVAGLSSATVSLAAATVNSTNYLVEGNSTQVDSVIAELDSALTTLRANASTIGGNVALLQTRLDFTKIYVNVLETGSAKLTLADINEEGANLLALADETAAGYQLAGLRRSGRTGYSGIVPIR
jgi:flagellin